MVFTFHLNSLVGDQSTYTIYDWGRPMVIAVDFDAAHAGKWYVDRYGPNSGNLMYIYDEAGTLVFLRTYQNRFEMRRQVNYRQPKLGVAPAEEMRGDNNWVKVLWVDEAVVGQPLRFVILHKYELEAVEFTMAPLTKWSF